jgi:hypothetical protein
MDTDAFFHRIKQRVAGLEAGGRRIPPDIKKTIRQRPQHGYRLDSLERLAEALDWSVPELLAGIWQKAKFSEDAVPYGLHRHAVCLDFACKTHVVNQLLPPEANERRLENRVAELYQQWLDYEKASGHPVDEFIYFCQRVEQRAVEMTEERPAAEASRPPSEQPQDPTVQERKAAADDKPPLAA